MAQVIEFGNKCTCESYCGGEVCWLPAQRELARKLSAWRKANPSDAYHVSAHADRHPAGELAWDPRRGTLWDLLAPSSGRWRQAYDVREERIVVRQVLAGDVEEHYVVEPTMRAVPLRERARIPALVVSA